MKKILFVLCTLMLMVSCTDESENVVGGKISSLVDNVSVVAVSNGKVTPVAKTSKVDLALSFADEASFDAFKEKLCSLSSDQRTAWISRYGILNLHDLASQADDELENMGNKASTMSEFRTMYKAYKEKYAGLLTLDETDNSDVSLYVPKGESVESYIANEQGYYVVGNEVRRYDPSKISLSKSGTLLTRATEAGTNNICFNPNGMSNKEIYFSTYLELDYVRVSMHAKKKMWYGWKNDPSRNYFFDSYLNNINYVSLNQNGEEVISPRLPRYIFTNNVKNGFDIRLAKRPNNTFRVSGEFYVWCDYTAEHDKDWNYLEEKINGFKTIKCLKEKAQIVKVDL